jgi:putative Holliday junction resolvase
MKVLSIDYGTRRVGLATCDELGITVTGLPTMASEGLKKDAHRLSALVHNIGAGAVILGLPLTISGDAGPAAHRVQKLADRLGTLTSVPVITVDERLTTVEAQHTLKTAGVSCSRQRERTDQLAAMIILNDYLALQERAEKPVL